MTQLAEQVQVALDVLADGLRPELLPWAVAVLELADVLPLHRLPTYKRENERSWGILCGNTSELGTLLDRSWSGSGTPYFNSSEAFSGSSAGGAHGQCMCWSLSSSGSGRVARSRSEHWTWVPL
jgi:hypothetical protein